MGDVTEKLRDVIETTAGVREVTSREELRALIGEPHQRARDKVRSVLHPLDRDWLAASPFCVLATSDAEGRLDASPKGDPAGQLVQVLDDTTIALAERPGNRRVDGYLNVLDNPYVGLIFLIPGRGDTLRINGRARLVADAPSLDALLFDRLAVNGRRPVLVLLVTVQEVFHHCAKAFLRSSLWRPETWADPLPRRAVIAASLERGGRSDAEIEDHYGPGYAEQLY